MCVVVTDYCHRQAETSTCTYSPCVCTVQPAAQLRIALHAFICSCVLWSQTTVTHLFCCHSLPRLQPDPVHTHRYTHTNTHTVMIATHIVSIRTAALIRKHSKVVLAKRTCPYLHEQLFRTYTHMHKTPHMAISLAHPHTLLTSSILQANSCKEHAGTERCYMSPYTNTKR